MDILVQPMQRLTKYGLLLKAILKNTDEDVEREALSAMVPNTTPPILHRSMHIDTILSFPDQDGRRLCLSSQFEHQSATRQ